NGIYEEAGRTWEGGLRARGREFGVGLCVVLVIIAATLGVGRWITLVVAGTTSGVQTRLYGTRGVARASLNPGLLADIPSGCETATKSGSNLNRPYLSAVWISHP